MLRLLRSRLVFVFVTPAFSSSVANSPVTLSPNLARSVRGTGGQGLTVGAGA